MGEIPREANSDRICAHSLFCLHCQTGSEKDVPTAALATPNPLKSTQQLRMLNIPFLIRGRSNTMVRVYGKPLSLGRRPHRAGVPSPLPQCGLSGFLPSAREHRHLPRPDFQEPWFLLVPAALRLTYPLQRQKKAPREKTAPSEDQELGGCDILCPIQEPKWKSCMPGGDQC